MATVQLTFTLRTSPNVKTVHLLGSWDSYTGQLPLSRTPSGKPGSWKGTFRFSPPTLNPGQRYWYYYILDGYSVSHDPAKSHTREPTTGRLLNILDVPHAVIEGRPLSPSRIVHPKPSKPYASRKVREADYERSPVDEADALTAQLEAASLYPRGSPTSSTSGFSSSGRSSASHPDSPASLSSLSDSSGSSCRCNRWGITRSGKKVLLDCGGSRCNFSDESSEGSGSDEDGETESDSEILEDSSDEESSDEEEEVQQKPKLRIKTIQPKQVQQQRREVRGGKQVVTRRR